MSMQIQRIYYKLNFTYSMLRYYNRNSKHIPNEYYSVITESVWNTVDYNQPKYILRSNYLTYIIIQTFEVHIRSTSRKLALLCSTLNRPISLSYASVKNVVFLIFI